MAKHKQTQGNEPSIGKRKGWFELGKKKVPPPRSRKTPCQVGDGKSIVHGDVHTSK